MGGPGRNPRFLWATAIGVFASGLQQPAAANDLDEILAERPAFSAGDQPARAWAGCGEIRPMSAGLPETEERIDLSVAGPVAAVSTDGALWYVVLCQAPDVQILCVTYSANGLEVGGTAYAKGGYRRIDTDHAVLDPCLASDSAEW